MTATGLEHRDTPCTVVVDLVTERDAHPDVVLGTLAVEPAATMRACKGTHHLLDWDEYRRISA